LAIGYWLLAIGYWLLAIGYWLLAIGSRPKDTAKLSALRHQLLLAGMRH
jgi:hypothetical protein